MNPLSAAPASPQQFAQYAGHASPGHAYAQRLQLPVEQLVQAQQQSLPEGWTQFGPDGE